MEKYDEVRVNGEEKKETPAGVAGVSFGGLEGDRTLGLTDANRTLSQLSYAPE